MKTNALTIQNIADALKISISTVSKALRDSHEISPKTKKRIVEYAKRHNYRPNPIAQSLKLGRSKSIGVLVSTIEHQFFSQVINGIESVAYQAGFNVIISQTHESYDLEKQNVNNLVHRSVDGLLISLTTETKDTNYLKRLQAQGLPIVLFDRVTRDLNTHKVIVDNFGGSYQATKHLIDAGYRNIAHITSSASASISQERLAGYKKALEDNGITVNDAMIKYCDHGGRDANEIRSAIDELMALIDKPDALLSASDRITTTSLGIFAELGIKIPEQIAVIGYTNLETAPLLNPPLSTIYQPGFKMGQKATELLITLLQAKRQITEFETVVLPTQLFVRASACKKV